jgi:hypothetical protein
VGERGVRVNIYSQESLTTDRNFEVGIGGHVA